MTTSKLRLVVWLLVPAIGGLALVAMTSVGQPWMIVIAGALFALFCVSEAVLGRRARKNPKAE